MCGSDGVVEPAHTRDRAGGRCKGSGRAVSRQGEKTCGGCEKGAWVCGRRGLENRMRTDWVGTLVCDRSREIGREEISWAS